jgi:hypothetical protein
LSWEVVSWDAVVFIQVFELPRMAYPWILVSRNLGIIIRSFRRPYLLFLCADVSTTMIVKPGPVVDFLIMNQNVRDPYHIDWTKVANFDFPCWFWVIVKALLQIRSFMG